MGLAMMRIFTSAVSFTSTVSIKICLLKIPAMRKIVLTMPFIVCYPTLPGPDEADNLN